MFPALPASPLDQRFHLQVLFRAFRLLWKDFPGRMGQVYCSDLPAFLRDPPKVNSWILFNGSLLKSTHMRRVLSRARCASPGQAFRHLYMLAAEPRTVQAVDNDSKRPVYVPLRITLKGAAAPAAAHAASPAPPSDGLTLGDGLRMTRAAFGSSLPCEFSQTECRLWGFGPP